MTDIADWLERLGLGEYGARFAENAVDLAVLPQLTDDDLKELGVLLGHRRKLLRAIAELRSNGSDDQDPDTAERRQITVLFCDLVDSTALAGQLDPEDMREVLRTYQDTCTQVVARYEGFVALFLGDGIVCYFGYPHAQEDAAERAVRAGLEMVASIAQLETSANHALAARVGIATGRVVVGDLLTTDGARQRDVVGDTPNLAARLQSVAKPGGVVVAESTHDLLGDLFATRHLGRIELKGIKGPVSAWAVLSSTDSDSRFDSVRGHRTGTFVGRERELAVLLERQKAAWAGEGQVVAVAGEPGIGKSRLLAHFAGQLGQPVTRVRYQCSPYHANSALFPFTNQLERAAGLLHDDPPERRLEKLENTLRIAVAEPGLASPVLASLLSIPFGGRYPPLNLSPIQQRRQTFSALLDQLEGLSRRGPVLVLFEDAHWADATSLELLDLTVDRIRHLPALVLVTCRPPFEPSWIGLPNSSLVALGRLETTEAQRIVTHVAGGRELPAQVRDQIIARTDGIPLFVEELTKTVLDAGILVERGGGLVVDGAMPPFAIPATLQDSLMARLDRLQPVREIAQTAAVIGREFSYALLAAVARRHGDSLKAGLDALEQAELLTRRGAVPDATYAFKHALVRDAAYETLLKARRAVLHQAVAETLCARFPGLAELEPEVVAEHFTQAGLSDRAIEWWSKAGNQALKRSAFIEAMEHFRSAIRFAETLSDGADRSLLLLRLQNAYCNAVLPARGYTAPETAAAFARARALAVDIEDAAERYTAVRNLWAASYVRGDIASMVELVPILLREIEGQPHSADTSTAHNAAGATAAHQGQYSLAREHLELALAHYDDQRDRGTGIRLGIEYSVANRANLALVLWPTGEVGHALQLMDEALGQAVEIGHLPSIAYAHYFTCVLASVRGAAEEARRHAESLVGLAREHGFPFWESLGLCFRGWSRFCASREVADLSEMREAIAHCREQGIGLFMPFLLALQAGAEAEADNTAALDTLDASLTLLGRTGERRYEAEILRMRAAIMRGRAPADVAGQEAALQQAVSIARQQGTRVFALRAALALSTLRLEAGRQPDIAALLAPAVAELDGVLDLPELLAAKRMLTHPSP